MNTYSKIAIALLGFTALAHPAAAQSTAGVDPACIIKNADGTETVDKTKCPDGMKPATAGSTTEATPEAAPDANSTAKQDSTGTTPSTTAADDPAATTGTTTTANDPATTATDPASTTSVIVPADAFANAKVMTASDFIGKRVYSKAGDDIGEVNDLIVTDNGAVQAVILGVGGFLGIGEKDVAVAMRAIEMQPDGDSVKLVVDASKDQLNSAPGYDRTKRVYVN